MKPLFSEEDDNIYMKWSETDDQILYKMMKNGDNYEEIANKLKRGLNGIKSRWQRLNNPNHQAYRRLFKSPEDPSFDKVSLRACKEVIERILWDPALDSSDFSFIYNDRYVK